MESSKEGMEKKGKKILITKSLSDYKSISLLNYILGFIGIQEENANSTNQNVGRHAEEVTSR